jgi:hypothetical protein
MSNLGEIVLGCGSSIECGYPSLGVKFRVCRQRKVEDK